MTASAHPRLSAIVPLPVSVAANPAAAFDPLAGRPTLLRIVQALVDVALEPVCVVVAAADRLVGDVRRLLADAGLGAIGVASAGDAATRPQCLAAGLKHIVNDCVSARYVLVYDIRQPLVSADARDRVIARLTAGDPIVLPALPVTDSVKAVDQHGAVTATVDRSMLRVVQYPRGFAIDRLATLLADADAEFDEVHAAIGAAAPVTMVDGDGEAFIADLPGDARFVEAVIASRPR